MSGAKCSNPLARAAKKRIAAAASRYVNEGNDKVASLWASRYKLRILANPATDPAPNSGESGYESC
jgi:hypothetical protein